MTGSRGDQVGGIKGGVVWGLQVSKRTLVDCISLTVSLIYGTPILHGKGLEFLGGQAS